MSGDGRAGDLPPVDVVDTAIALLIQRCDLSLLRAADRLAALARDAGVGSEDLALALVKQTTFDPLLVEPSEPARTAARDELDRTAHRSTQ